MTERTLVLLRHSKAEHGDAADMDRSLTQRGHADAAAAGAWLARRGHVPDLVICSPARRTRQTWHAVAVALGEANPAAPVVRYEREAYDGSADDLLTLIRDIGDEFGTVLVIGHNPAISQLSATLDPESARDSEGLRTSGIAVHGVPDSWANCGVEPAPVAGAHTARG